jgi:hypothetical protein
MMALNDVKVCNYRRFVARDVCMDSLNPRYIFPKIATRKKDKVIDIDIDINNLDINVLCMVNVIYVTLIQLSAVLF